MSYKYLLFDLDGTLIDSSEGITKSVVYALVENGFEAGEPSQYIGFIGPPMEESLNKMGFDQETTGVLIKYYRQRFEEVGWKENKPYEGIIQTLHVLKEKYILGVATSKPTLFAERILTALGISDCFDVIVGSNMDRTRVAKKDVIEEALRQLGNPSVEDVLMIGDREHDILGAKAHHMDVIRVMYGFGEKDEHEGLPVLAVCKTVAELRDFLLK